MALKGFGFGSPRLLQGKLLANEALGLSLFFLKGVLSSKSVHRWKGPWPKTSAQPKVPKKPLALVTQMA